MEIISRKQKEINTPFTKLNKWLVYAIMFVSFLFCDLYYIRTAFISTEVLMLQMFGMQVEMTSGMYIAYLLFNALLQTIVLEVVFTIYYYFSYQSMRFFMPFSLKEFKANIRPFFIVRNLIWTGLSLLMLLPKGYFVGVGAVAFEMIANVIVFFPAFFFMKKYYIKEGWNSRILMSFAMTFIIFNGVSIVSGIVSLMGV